MDLITMGARQILNFVNRSLCQFHHSFILPGKEKTCIRKDQHKLLRTMFWKQI